jgi:protein-disulfide isomerase
MLAHAHLWTMKRLQGVIEIVVTALVGAMAIVVVWSRVAPPRAGGEGRPLTKVLDGRVVELGTFANGSQQAPVALIEFSDFECAFCRGFAQDTLPALEQRYIRPGQLLVAFRHFPNEQKHLHARYAAEASVCAAKQGLFWEFHEAIFRINGPLDRSTIRGAALSTAALPGEFDKCMGAEDNDAVIDGDVRDALALHLSGTPSFILASRTGGGSLVGRVQINGSVPLDTFTTEIDRLLR